MIGFGPSSTSKYVTTYFRQAFNATNGFTSLSLRLRRDDGAVVYLNGIEVARSNMPTGTISSSTLAPSTMNGTNETTFFTIPISGQLYQGKNVLAVEVHQAARTSSDLVFDAARYDWKISAGTVVWSDLEELRAQAASLDDLVSRFQRSTPGGVAPRTGVLRCA